MPMDIAQASRPMAPISGGTPHAFVEHPQAACVDYCSQRILIQGLEMDCGLGRADHEQDSLHDRLLKSEALNAELARMLKRLEWRGCSEEHAEECPLCLSPRWWDGEETDHNEGCELFALLKKATTE